MLNQMDQTKTLIEKCTLLCQTHFGNHPQHIEFMDHQFGYSFWLEQLVDWTDSRLPTSSDTQYLYVHTLLHEYISPLLQKAIIKSTGKSIFYVFIDWKSDINVGCMTFVFSDWISTVPQKDYAGKQQIHDAISEISHEIENPPSFIESFWVNEQTLVVIRAGFVMQLEQKLVNKGFSKQLRIAKRELELELIENSINYDSILGKSLHMTFLDWNPHKDISTLILLFQ
ncbi:hypothetical protein ACE3MZ_05315 [Paenibacillus sp. WLX1005]|uniref:hypothetical protein n=1 Tax=Paenibacillus sp. WLX1005 TaxID=3243766 RepID=UPI003983DB12